jgi:hypothetical protein
MSNMTKRIVRAGLVAASLMSLAPLAAWAGEWRINARACPDLREDIRDYRYNDGWRDRREDRHDARVIRCPAKAWYYVRYAGERRNSYVPPRPREIVIDRWGREYYRDNRGAVVYLDVDFDYGRRDYRRG